jgi:CheY-like chemotaxis protein
MSEAPGSELVLVVDDDPIVRGLICRALEDEGLTVVAAENGELAVSEATRARPSLVVLDVSLPVLASDVVAARLRQLGPDDLPVLVITADGRASEKARALGAYAYLQKPFDIDRLVDLVERGLQRGR